MHRRAFLATAFIPMLPTVASAQRPAAAAASTFDPWIEINTAHLRHNAGEVARLTRQPVLAVVKNNGYGLGVVQSATALESHPAVHGFAVVKLQEALDLREAGVKKPILLMAPVDERDVQLAVGRNIMPMVYTPLGDVLERESRRLGRPISIHVCVDTGLGRVGVPYRHAAALVRELASRKGITIAGTMMTFTEDLAFDREQAERFRSLTGELKAGGVDPGRLHAASTYTLFQHGQATWFDMSRVGMGLLGLYPDQKFKAMNLLDLRPALAFRVRVAYVKQLNTGESAGYERAYVAGKPTWIATLPVGHADGWPRAAARGGRVRINGQLYPVIASVSASHTLVEVGETQTVATGDVATLFDWEDGSRPEDVSARTGASVYDLTMHLSPLLSRRAI